MRILILSQWYAPEPAALVTGLAKSLAARGHDVSVLTGYPNYPTGALYPGYRVRLVQREVNDGTAVTRVPLYPDHSRSATRRSLNYLSFAASATILGPLVTPPADVMWVYHPPLTVGVPASWIGLTRRIPFVYTIQDMWPESVVAADMGSNTPMLRALTRLAAFVYHRAAAITVISPGFERNLVAKGVPPQKIEVIPNWADDTVYHPVPRDDILASDLGMLGKFNVVYAGSMGPGQALSNVLAAASLLRDEPAVQFVVIGDGIERADLQRQAEGEGLQNVRFLPWQPADRMPGIFALADALLVHLKRDALYAITIPSKILSYLACGRPILCAVAGDAADVVLGAGAGLTCQPQDPRDLAQSVRRLVAMPAQEREALGQAGHRAFLANYTEPRLVSRYEALFQRVAATHRTP